jgi:hypothetical protein
MSPTKKKAMIRRDHPDLSISQQCRLVKLSRSAFCYAPVGIDAATLLLMKAIDRVFTKYPFFGSRQIAAYLRREGIVAGRHRVRRLMAKMGPPLGRFALQIACRATGGDPQASTHQPAAPAAPGPSVSAQRHGDRPPEPGLVCRHHLRAGEARLPLLGRNHGLGDAQGVEPAAVEQRALVRHWSEDNGERMPTSASKR